MTASHLSGLIDFKTLFQLAPDAVVVHDLADRVIFCNREAEVLYGWSEESLQGRCVTHVLYLDGSARQEALETLLRGELWQGELRQLDHRGNEHLVQVRQRVQRDANGEAVAIISFNTDVTERRREADAAARACRMKSSSLLANNMAHELNNALGPIMLSAAMLQRSIKDERALNLVGMIEKCAAKGAKLVATLQSFERGKGGGSDKVNIAQIRSALERICDELLPDSIRSKITIAEDLWECRGQLSELNLVYQHVIQNACEAMPQGGTLSVKVDNCRVDEHFKSFEPEARVGNYICLVFADTGLGIQPEALPHVVEPFYTTKSPRRDFGFGLSISQTIIKGHRGFMRVESQFGFGSQVSLFLPADAGVAELGAGFDQFQGNGELVLVAEEEIFVRQAVKEVLENSGYRVLMAQDGTEALALYVSRQSEIDLVMTNVEMPFLDGSALCRALWQLNPKVKVLMSSELAQSDRVRTLESCGEIVFLMKPYTAANLVECVHALLNLKR
jgi:PAS domain S-box-containing protein